MLISHPHIDHYGYFEHLRDDMPYYVGAAAKKLIDLTVLFTSQKGHIGQFKPIEDRKAFKIKSFTITPFLVDHSAFDAYAFLIEAGGKKLFYSGDFRAHGRKAKLFHKFIRNGPTDIDTLLIEGTMFGRSSENVKKESDIEKEILDIAMSSNKNIILAYLSSQNIDRLVTLFRVARRSSRLFVIDFYTANILSEIKDHARVPYTNKSIFPEVRVYFPHLLANRIAEKNRKKLIYRYRYYKINRNEISKKKHKIIMLVRPSVIFDLRLIKGLDRGDFIYSIWQGYLNNTHTMELIDFVKDKNMRVHNIHTSGHADIDTLKKMVDKLNPKTVIPIHTNYPEQYENQFTGFSVCMLKDKEEFYF
ncbi:MBL fold metallo-hydrolase [bacterium]|nr:MBL fold metallo-hydrolase [bacterium]